MKSTPPPGPHRRSHPPPPLKSRAPQPETTAARVEQKAIEESVVARAEAEDAAKAALDAVDVEITTDGLVAEASTTPAPVATIETKPSEPKPAAEAKPTAEPTAPAGKSEPAKPAAATSTPAPSAPATSTPAPSTSTPAPAQAASSPPTAATSTPVPAAASKGATPPPRTAADDAAHSKAAKPSSGPPAFPTKQSATATPAPVASATAERANAPPPVVAKPTPEAAAAASLTPPPARIPIRDKADLSGTPTAPVAPRERVAAARSAAVAAVDGRGDGSASRSVDEADAVGPQRKLGESVNVPVSSLMVAGGALIVMAMTGFLVGRSSSSSSPPRAQTGIHLVIANPTSTPASNKPVRCTVTLNAQRWAPKASKSIPFELLAAPSGKLAIGYARDDNEAAGLDVEPASGEAKESFSKDTTEQIEHVMPNPAGGFTVIAPGESAALKNTIEVPIATPFYIGVADGSLVSSDKPDAPGPKLWALPSGDAINSERVEEAGAKGFAYTFRQGNDVYGGWLDPSRRPVGELVRVAGSGGSVGKPMSAFNGSETAVIFADRPTGAKTWQIRIGHAAAGKIPSETKVIPLPKGGPGGDAFAPDIAGLADGRWVLVWTEGPAGGRAVRAQTLSPRLEPIGDPLALSPPAGNFGQGVIGVIGERATVVFLSKGSQSFELWGAVLTCG
jgi:hypothetical protein